jgi:hypothetical protein
MLVAVDALAQPGAAGVMIDAQGVLRTTAVADAGLSAAHRKAAVTALPGDLQKPAVLRKVALSRLDAELAAAIAGGRGIPPELTRLAGLTRVPYVFVYPAWKTPPAASSAPSPAARSCSSRTSPPRSAASPRASPRTASSAARSTRGRLA